MQSKMAILSKSRSLIKTINHNIYLLKSISTVPFLTQQQPQLSHDSSSPSDSSTSTSIPIPIPLPPNPATGSPVYQDHNWRNPIPYTVSTNSLIPVGPTFLHQHSHQIRDRDSLKNLFADWMTQSRWLDIVEFFDAWIRTVDRTTGALNRPDVMLYNQYLWAHLMRGASAADLLDLVAKMEEFRIEPDTASFNLVIKAMHRSGETDAAIKLIQRMKQLEKESQPDDVSYNLVLSMLFRQDRIEDALNYIDVTLKSGYKLSSLAFADCVRSCIAKKKLDSLVSVIEKCQASDQNKDLCPNWNMCNVLAQVAIQNEHSRLAFLAMKFMVNWIAIGEKGSPPGYRSVNEALIVSALTTAGKTYDSALLDASWVILRKSLRDRRKPEPQTYLAKIRAQASIGNLQGAFSTLSELERVYANSPTIDEEAVFSPFTSLYPLVVACSKKGFETLDLVYFQLENLSRANPPYKSVAALNCVILGCANTWDLDRAYQTFEAIGSTFGLSPNIHSYNALLYAFGKLKKTEEATRVFEHVTSLGLKPNAMSYRLLTEAHLVNRDPKAAIAVINDMVGAGFQPTRETLLKVRRRSIRELDYETNDKVAEIARQFKIIMPSENRRNTLFNLQYSTPEALAA